MDPDEPSVTVLELQAGRYAEVAHAVGEQGCHVALPFPLEIVPARLRD